MKVRIKTGKKYRPTKYCEIYLSGNDNIIIITGKDISPRYADLTNQILNSLKEISLSFNFENFKIDQRDSNTIWLWKIK